MDYARKQAAMKRMIIFVLLLHATGAFAQGYEGQVQISSKQLQECNDTLYMSLEIMVQARSVGNCQTLRIVPELKSTDSTRLFPAILINGGNSQQIFERRQLLESKKRDNAKPLMVISVDAKTDTLLKYAIRVPYLLWMDKARLIVRQELYSCSNRPRLFTTVVNNRVSLEPRTAYQVNPLVTYVRPPYEKKTLKIQGSAFLDFQVGRSVILPGFRRNPEELTKIKETIEEIRSNKDAKISRFLIIGTSSPDGLYSTNERLSSERAVALKEYIRQNYGIGSNLFQVNSIAEDWATLRDLVKESNIPKKDTILSIVDNTENPDQRADKLRKVLGETVYRKLLIEFYPQLRRVDFQVDFEVRDYTYEESKGLITRGQSLQWLSQQELYRVAEGYERNSKEFGETFDLILKLYPDDPIANINAGAVMIERGELSTAKRCLERFKGDSRAWNNLGVLYLKTGDLEMAHALFLMARSASYREAEHNIRELHLKREDNKKMGRFSR